MGQRCNRADRDRREKKEKERKRIGGGGKRDCKLESLCCKAGRKKRVEADGVAMARLRVDTETCGGRRRRRKRRGRGGGGGGRLAARGAR